LNISLIIKKYQVFCNGHYKVGKTKNLKQRLKQYNGDKKDDIIPLYVYETDNIDLQIFQKIFYYLFLILKL
jgi:excinuclease UvrABC nuclease subunit